jgi:hypothetical protein
MSCTLTSVAWSRKTAFILFLGLFACYVALAPGTTEGRGYVPDDMNAGLSLLASFNAWVKGRPAPPISWTRHGPAPVLLDLPFIKLGKLFVSPDFVLSLQPVLLTAALLSILCLWLNRFCTPGVSLLLTLTGAFGTMLWPYAYIGLETKQSFFVFLAGYLALGNEKIRTWPRLVLFALVCAFALTAKATGIVLAPVILWLVYVQFRTEWRVLWKQALTLGLIVGTFWGLNVLAWNLFWNARGGGANALHQWMIDSPFQLFTNAVGLFGSPGKGLFIFAPALLLSVYAIPRAFRAQREATVFGLLVTACTVAFLSVLIAPSDEVWGPRFMHIAIAPLLIIIGAAWPRFRWRTHAPALILGAVGLAISFLGAFYYYGARGWAAAAANQNTMEWQSGDNVWNEVRFNARLFRVWLKGGTDPVLWTPSHVWTWAPPKDAQPWKSVNLRDYADPQSFLLYYFNAPLDGSNLVIFRICWLASILGPLLLAWAVARTCSPTRPQRIGD